MDFIFMFTRNDQTVEDCLDVLNVALDSGVRHLGFKDVGVSIPTLDKLTEGIRQAGATAYLEVVSTTPLAMVQSAKNALILGVHHLLGGTEAREMLTLLEGSEMEYHPFPGRPEGHPTRLGGSPEEIAEDCSRFEAMGCAGVDLLAYRAFECDPLQAVEAARAAISGRLVVAGSISTPSQIEALAKRGVDAFTIGSAALDGSFSPRKGHLGSQLKDILAACG